jgi:hypothetical protein
VKKYSTEVMILKHVSALIGKYIIVTLVIYLVLGLTSRVSLLSVLMLGLIVTGLGYVLGDLVILPAATKATNGTSGNIIAAVADFGLVFFTLWIIGSYFVSGNINWFTSSFIAAAIIAVGEVLFHIILRGSVMKQMRTE